MSAARNRLRRVHIGLGSLCWVTLLAGGTAAARRAVGARAIRLADAVAGAGLIAFGVALVAL